MPFLNLMAAMTAPAALSPPRIVLQLPSCPTARAPRSYAIDPAMIESLRPSPTREMMGVNAFVSVLGATPSKYAAEPLCCERPKIVSLGAHPGLWYNSAHDKVEQADAGERLRRERRRKSANTSTRSEKPAGRTFAVQWVRLFCEFRGGRRNATWYSCAIELTITKIFATLSSSRFYVVSKVRFSREPSSVCAYPEDHPRRDCACSQPRAPHRVDSLRDSLHTLPRTKIGAYSS